MKRGDLVREKGKSIRERDLPAAAASELNNLLQIVSGTISLLEGACGRDADSRNYFEILRTCVDRASRVTSRRVERAGGPEDKVLLHPDYRPTAAEAILPDPLEKERCILVIDDEPMALALSTYVLNQAGFSVVTARSGAEALKLFAGEPNRFSLVLLDLSMPEMDGEETFRRLLQIDPQVRCFAQYRLHRERSSRSDDESRARRFPAPALRAR